MQALTNDRLASEMGRVEIVQCLSPCAAAVTQGIFWKECLERILEWCYQMKDGNTHLRATSGR